METTESTVQPDAAEETLARGEFRRAAILFLLPPLMFLVAIIVSTFIFFLAHLPSFIVPIPLILTLSGIAVAFFGAYWDFGAKKYLDDLFKNRIQVKESDIVYINRQQLIMTALFFGIGGLYVLAALLIYFYII